jgi:hypothetical protein
MRPPTFATSYAKATAVKEAEASTYGKGGDKRA